MSRIARITVATLLGLVVATQPAVARDLRSPDARDAAVQSAPPPVDLRSPDAHDAALPTRPAPAAVDLRSPDARDAALPPTRPVAGAPSDGFAWGYLAVGTAALVLLTGVVVTTGRRRRVKHPLAAG